MKKSPFGVWEITLPAIHGKPAIPHNTKVKVSIGFREDASLVRIINLVYDLDLHDWRRSWSIRTSPSLDHVRALFSMLEKDLFCLLEEYLPF